jgi:hypothetical protein
MSFRGPGGPPPPAVVHIAGDTTPLAPLAEAICLRYIAEFPDEQQRYGDAGLDWCRHDNQWLLSWGVSDVLGATDLCEQVRWLARVLQSRDFPVDRLARDLQIAAEIAAAGTFGYLSSAVAARLLIAADMLTDADLSGVSFTEH